MNALGAQRGIAPENLGPRQFDGEAENKALVRLEQFWNVHVEGEPKGEEIVIQVVVEFLYVPVVLRNEDGRLFLAAKRCEQARECFFDFVSPEKVRVEDAF